MKRKKDSLWAISGGELLYKGLKKDTKLKYKADTPFDHSLVPYLILVFCAAVDGAVFYSLFSAISYDSPMLLMVQIAGFLFGFDVVPIYIGIHLRRLRQRLSRDWFILWLALGACALVVGMNVVLRLTTMEKMAPVSPLQTSFLGALPTAGRDTGTIAGLTVFGIGIPLVTSVGSFFISYMTYDPMKIRRKREEERIAEKRDEIRRLEAVLADYDAELDFAEHLLAEDQGRYEAMKRCHRAVVLSACRYARRKLALEEGSSEELLEALEAELDVLKEPEKNMPTLNRGAYLRRMTR